MKIHYLQHIEFENPGIILEWAKENKIEVSKTLFYKGEKLPEELSFDCLVVMGGPMNIYEESKYPWLKAEKAFIKSAIEAKKVVLGICLGAQLIADVIGGKVEKNKETEIGWFPIQLTAEGRMNNLFDDFLEEPIVFHWHGDYFTDLPEEARVFAKSEGCQHQGFVVNNRVFGFQFHLENTNEIIKSLVDKCGDEMIAGRFIQTALEVLNQDEKIKTNNRLMKKFLDHLLLEN